MVSFTRCKEERVHLFDQGDGFLESGRVGGVEGVAGEGEEVFVFVVPVLRPEVA